MPDDDVAGRPIPDSVPDGMEDLLQAAEEYIRETMDEHGVDRLEAICHMEHWLPSIHAAFMKSVRGKPMSSW